jgi:hypothetical protein
VRTTVPAEEEAKEEARLPLGERIRQALRFGFGEVADETAAWILAGVAVAAAIEPASLSSWFSRLPAGTDVVAAAFVGLPTYVCASGATPLAAALLLAGVSPGAAIAFLLAGPATNVTTFGVLSRLHGRSIALAFGACMMLGAIGVGVVVNLVVDPASVPSLAGEEHAAPWWAWTSLIAIGVVYLAALVRQGPRRFVENVVSLGQGGDHDHDHDHDHGHGGHDHGGHDDGDGCGHGHDCC